MPLMSQQIEKLHTLFLGRGRGMITFVVILYYIFLTIIEHSNIMR